ncbi:hypothetical protein JD292_08100 [Leucobacter sp. CSA2]|uniref:2,4-diaminopentanoate dehydrogenase C-terminal domain-containing protein n=1 Tax=Leucobacter edaphi TaxID=2796472 RepID=A0A934QEM0_9MICO|nr:hypothetical protein [Leucobacter edaphi]MBK0422034.1 hypothetical protein [Leucobacter edaphi]
MTDRIPPRVVLVGLGAVGRAVGARVIADGRARVIGAVDRAPALAGVPLDDLLPGAAPEAPVVTSIAEAPDADVAFVATTSHIAGVEPAILELLDRGMHVVSIAEELGYGHYDHQTIAARIDERATARGLTVLGTGCNPGILLDTLPLLLTGLTSEVTRVTVRRTAEMSGYGGILAKFGFGLDEQAFARARTGGEVIGHVGFRESVAALAAGLGWQLEEIEVDDPAAALLAPAPRATSHLTLDTDSVVVVRHAARGLVGGDVVIDAVIDFGIFEEGDPFPEGDRWLIESEARTIEFASSRIDSSGATVSVAANVIPSAAHLPPGLLTMADLPVQTIAGRAAPRTATHTSKGATHHV